MIALLLSLFLFLFVSSRRLLRPASATRRCTSAGRSSPRPTPAASACSRPRSRGRRTRSAIVVGGRGNSRGYNGIGGGGQIASGSTATYSTPAGKSVTVIHCRNVSSILNFALARGNANADFPTRIVLTKTTGGTVTRTATPRAAAPRTVSGGFRKDYDVAGGRIQDVLVNNQTVRVELFY